MDTLGGGWERVAHFQSASSLTECPSPDLALVPFSGTLLCSNNGTAANITLTPTAPFSEVRGTISAYAIGDVKGFLPNLSPLQSREFNGNFIDGVAVMLDDRSGFLKHVHSEAAGRIENVPYMTRIDATCPSVGAKPPTSIIGPHYGCSLLDSQTLLDSANPLPFGELSESLCTVRPEACVRPSAWFHRQLPVEVTPDEADLLLRVLSELPNEILLHRYQLYTR